MLNEAMLGCVQAAIEGMLPDACTITRRTGTRDASGGYETTHPAVATTVCLITTDGKPQEVPVGQTLRMIVPWVITLPLGTDVRPEDRIVSGGRTFEVVGTDRGRSLPVSVKATCMVHS